MRTSCFIGAWIALTLVASSPTRADFSPAEPTTVERFARSMTEMYKIAAMCQDFPDVHAEKYMNEISVYMEGYFQKRAPYWVLPTITTRIKNKEHCVYTMQHKADQYQEDSKNYAEAFPEDPLPPHFSSDTIGKPGTALAGKAGGVDGNSEHFLTPSVLVK